MSEFHIECVKIGEVTKHPNADSLSITMIHGGYPCIFRTGDYHEGDLAVYVPVDSLCPVAREEFKFLDTGKGREFERVKARRLRGIFSMGILVKAPEGAKVGQDFRAHFGIEKWEPEAEKEPVERHKVRRTFWSWTYVYVWILLKRLFGIVAPKPPVVPVYDIEGIRKHIHVLRDGEEVVLTEKIHGCSARYLHTGKKFYVSSRTQFRNKGPSVWHTAAERYNLEAVMAQNPGMVLFGEVYGSVQDLRYGVPAKEDVRFVVFDAMSVNTPGKRQYLSYSLLRNFCLTNGLPMVPELYVGPWDKSLVSHAEGKTTMPGANHVREGFVVKPTTERHDPHFGRVILKLLGEGYLTRKEQP